MKKFYKLKEETTETLGDRIRGKLYALLRNGLIFCDKSIIPEVATVITFYYENKKTLTLEEFQEMDQEDFLDMLFDLETELQDEDWEKVSKLFN